MKRTLCLFGLSILLMAFQNCGRGLEATEIASQDEGQALSPGTNPSPSPNATPNATPNPAPSPSGGSIGQPQPQPQSQALQNLWAPMVQNGQRPAPRWGHASAKMGDQLFIWGGWTGNPNELQYNTGAIYNPTTQAWTSISTTGAPIGRNVTRAVWTGSKIIIWGGVERVAGDVNTGAIYNPATDSWEPFVQKNTIPARHLHAMVWAAGKMYVFGGEGRTGGLADGHVYDPTTQMWTALDMTNGPGVDHTPSAVFTGEKILVFGGCQGSSNAVYVLDVALGTWQRRTPPTSPTARCGQSATWTGQEMLVFGGNLNGVAVALNTLLAYDFNKNSWREIPGPAGLTPRYFHSANFVNNKMYIFGGYTEFSNRPMGVDSGDVFY